MIIPVAGSIFLLLLIGVPFLILSYSSVLTIAIPLLIPILFAIFYLSIHVTREIPLGSKWYHEAGRKLAYIVIFGAYSMYVSISINCLFDNSLPEIYETRIERKFMTIHTGKSGTSESPTFTLSPWGNIQEPETIAVSDEIYEQKNKGDVIHVYEKRGLLHIPWYYIEE